MGDHKISGDRAEHREGPDKWLWAGVNRCLKLVVRASVFYEMAVVLQYHICAAQMQRLRDRNEGLPRLEPQGSRSRR